MASKELLRRPFDLPVKLGDEHWSWLLEWTLGTASSFRAVFGPDEFTGFGRFEFLAFEGQPGTEVYNWTGMEGAIVVEGPIDDMARSLFRRLTQWGRHPTLWYYGLFLGNVPILDVSDWSVGGVFLTDEDVRVLREAGVPVDGWDSGVIQEDQYWDWWRSRYRP